VRKRHARFPFSAPVHPSVCWRNTRIGGCAAFVQETCVAYIDDLSKLDDLAKEKGWQQIANLG
jgi:hypothetical protein